METFMAVCGVIIWILALGAVALWLATQLFDKYREEQDDKRRAIAINARKELGSDIKRSAHWLSGSEYDSVPPYVIFNELGKQIEETSHVDADKLRNILFEARDKYRDEFVQNNKTD